MQISIGSKQYSFSGDATPANIARQISEQESGINTQKLSQKLSEAVFGAAYRKHDIIDSSRFEGGVLALEPRGFERLFGQVASGGSSRAVLLTPPPRVVVQKAAPKPKRVPAPAVPMDVLAAASLNASNPSSETLVTKIALEAHPVFKRFIAPMLRDLRFTTFELTTPARDTNLETGAYFNPASNCVVLNQKAELSVVVDNLIFELCNAKNKTQFESITNAFQAGSININEYANAYAQTEFKTQMAYTDILSGMRTQGFELPTGAQKALKWVADTDPEFVRTGDPTKLLASFMTLPHDIHAGPRDVASLSTPDMYAYQALEKLGGQQLFDKLETTLGKGILPGKFSGWARHNFPMKSVSFKRAQAYQEVVTQAQTLLAHSQEAGTKLEGLVLSAALQRYASLRAGSHGMPPYGR